IPANTPGTDDPRPDRHVQWHVKVVENFFPGLKIGPSKSKMRAFIIGESPRQNRTPRVLFRLVRGRLEDGGAVRRPRFARVSEPRQRTAGRQPALWCRPT